MDNKKDLYILNFSKNFSISNNEEITMDLSLENSNLGTSSIVGVVLDGQSQPVEGATIKLFDSKGVPYLHTITNALGQYSFDSLLSNSYSISCVKDDIVLTVPEDIYLSNNEIKTHNFIVNVEPTLNLCAIAGLVLESGLSNAVIGGATVFLIDALTKDTVATTISASDGEYVFYDVAEGDYLVVATKLGYAKSNEIEVKATNNSIVNLNIKLAVNPIENVGTISGVITNNGKIVPNAFVGLYKIVDDKEVLVATTKTNASGLYMFGSVEAGNYKVKSKLNQNV